MRNLVQEARIRALRKALNDSDLRIFLWDLIETDCGAFERSYGHNATAYSLLARQQIGKMLLVELKDLDLEQVFQAEREYRQLWDMNSNTRRDEHGS